MQMSKKQQVFLKEGGDGGSRSSERKRSHFPKPLVKYSANRQVRYRQGKYIIRSRSVFDTPFDKFTFDLFDDKDRKNEQITTHCNYGFNYGTIKSYAKLLKIFVQAYDLKGLQQFYSTTESDLLRLNDEIPMDFGGCSPPMNRKLFEIEGNSYWNGDYFFKDMVLLGCLSQQRFKSDGMLNIKIGDQRIKPMYFLQSLVYIKFYDTESYNYIGEQNYTNLTRSFHIKLKQQYKLAMQAIQKNKEDLGICDDENHLFFAGYKNLLEEKQFYANLLAPKKEGKVRIKEEEEVHVKEEAKQQDQHQAITNTPQSQEQEDTLDIILKNGKRAKRSFEDSQAKIFIRDDRKTEGRRVKVEEIKQEESDESDESDESKRPYRKEDQRKKKKKKHKKRSIKKHRDSKNKKHKKKGKHGRRGK